MHIGFEFYIEEEDDGAWLYVVHDLRTDVFMAYERALYVHTRAMTLLLGIINRSARSLISDLVNTHTGSSIDTPMCQGLGQSDDEFEADYSNETFVHRAEFSLSLDLLRSIGLSN